MTDVTVSKAFVGREAELVEITNSLLTGDVLILGEAGIGKTALIEKVITKLELSSNNTIIRINVEARPYDGWLSQRIALLVYEQSITDENRLTKIKKWMLKYYPDLLQFIQTLLDIEGKVTGRQIVTSNSLGLLSHAGNPIADNDNCDQAITFLLDRYATEFKKSLYLVIEDTHELSLNDKTFLTDLLANHSSNVHIIMSRRTQEKNQSLTSSPEITYLMRGKRIVALKG